MKDLFAFDGMIDFEMELQAIEWKVGSRESGVGNNTIQRFFIIYRKRRAGKNDSFQAGFKRKCLMIRNDLAINVCFSHGTGDQLGVLRTEIEDQDSFRHAGEGKKSVARWRMERGEWRVG